MKRTFRFAVTGLLIGLLVCAALAALTLAIASFTDHAVIRINGEPLSNLGSTDGALAVCGVAFALAAVAVVLAFVVPAAVLLALTLAGLALLAAAAAVVGAAALVFSPVLGVAGLVWLAHRRRRRREEARGLDRSGAAGTASGGATIAG